ncbi:MAG: OmpH family outer membrane protein [Planctomycetes bacterium]|nr:OmpH family outer membrane protein [Planctomycetota bacterium]
MLAFSLIPMGASAASMPDGRKLALVDLQRVLSETERGRSAKKELEQAVAQSSAALDRMAGDLQKQFEGLSSMAAVLSEAELMRRQRELMVAEQQLQERYAQAQEGLTKQEASLLLKINADTAPIVRGIAAEEGIQIVLVRSELTVLDANLRIDITNRVIVAHDEKSAVSAREVAPAAAVPEIERIAVVDMQRVLNETTAGKRAREHLEASAAAKQKELDVRRRKLEEDQAKLASMQGDALAAAEEKLQREYYELQSVYMTLQQDLAEQEARTLETMYANCQKLTKELAKEYGLDLVLIKDQATVLFVSSDLDLTDEVIEGYDEQYK